MSFLNLKTDKGANSEEKDRVEIGTPSSRRRQASLPFRRSTRYCCTPSLLRPSTRYAICCWPPRQSMPESRCRILTVFLSLPQLGILQEIVVGSETREQTA